MLYLNYKMKPKEQVRESTLISKNGVFLCKDQKITALQKTNEQMKLQLAKELEMFNLLKKAAAETESKYNSLQTQNSFLEIEQSILQQSISKLSTKIQESHPYISELNGEIKAISEQISALQDELEKRLARVNEDSNLVKRYKDEVRNEKIMLKSEKNLTKISETFKKSSESYQKNIQILEGKLESKKRYLVILTKKVEKQRYAERNEQNLMVKKQVNYSSSKLKHSQNKNSVSNRVIKVEQQTKETKSQMKSYNDIIRKKNAILAQKK